MESKFLDLIGIRRQTAINHTASFGAHYTILLVSSIVSFGKEQHCFASRKFSKWIGSGS